MRQEIRVLSKKPTRYAIIEAHIRLYLDIPVSKSRTSAGPAVSGTTNAHIAKSGQYRGKMARSRSKRCTYRLGELFAGAGGMALGAHKAGMNGHRFAHVWANDMDKDACESLRRNLSVGRCEIHCGKVEELDFSKLPTIDGLAFGFPCNDFSVVGDRHGISGEYGGLYRWGIEALETFRPSFFVAENVSGLSSSGNNQDFEIILAALQKAGYDVWPHTYKFEEYGVPQARRRIIIVGFRKDLGIEDFVHPAPTHKDKPITCREALADLPDSVSNNELTKQSRMVIDRLTYIKPGENAFTAKLPPRLKLQMKSKATISQIYRRLKPDEPSYTVTGSGGGGTHLYHWKEPRALTNRERARLQTFPDSFIFYGGKESVRKQIGMAVPPAGAKVVFKAVLRALIKHNVPARTD